MTEQAEQSHPCDVPGCANTRTTQCTLTMFRHDAPLIWYIQDFGLIAGLRHIWSLIRHGDTDIQEYYCFTHAKEAGYCWGCGQFWAGNESFDFGFSGLCENCCEEEYEDDEDSEGYFADPYPVEALEEYEPEPDEEESEEL